MTVFTASKRLFKSKAAGGSGALARASKKSSSALLEVPPVRSHLDARATAEQVADAQGAQHRLLNPTTESGGPKGLEPTRYGDWERAGRCIDF